MHCPVIIHLQCNEDLDMVLTRLEAEATQKYEALQAERSRQAAEVATSRSRELARAQELESKAMERYNTTVPVRVVQNVLRWRGGEL